MSEAFFDIIFKTAQLFTFVPLIVALFRLKHLDAIKKILLVLLSIAALVSVFARYLWSLQENNLFLLHYYTVLEFCGWTTIFYLLFESERIKKRILIVGVIFVVLAILNTLFWQKLDTFNSNSRSLESIILVGFSLAYYVKLFKERKIQYLERNASFWINAAALIYFSGAFLLFGFSNLLLNLSSYKIKEIWVIHGLFLIVHYSLISVGIWIRSTSTTSH